MVVVVAGADGPPSRGVALLPSGWDDMTDANDGGAPRPRPPPMGPGPTL